MRRYIFFLKCSSVVVKIAAWIFLCLAILGGASLFSRRGPGNPRWMGLIILGVYTAFLFFFLFLVAKIADLLVKIISAGGGSACGGPAALPPGSNEIKKD